MSRPDPGAIGRTITPLSPEGDVTVDGRDYFARSVDGYLPSGTAIVVTECHDHCLLVSTGNPLPEARVDGAFMAGPPRGRPGGGTITSSPSPPRGGDGAFTLGPPAPAAARAGAGARPERADAEFVGRRLGEGAAPADVRDELVARGIDPSTAAAVVREQYLLAVYGIGAAMLDGGETPVRTEQRLLEMGLEPHAARLVVRDLLARARMRTRPPASRGLALLLLGFLVMTIGAGLWAGNVSGLFPTFPFAGYLVMGAGAAMLRVAFRSG